MKVKTEKKIQEDCYTNTQRRGRDFCKWNEYPSLNLQEAQNSRACYASSADVQRTNDSFCCAMCMHHETTPLRRKAGHIQDQSWTRDWVNPLIRWSWA